MEKIERKTIQNMQKFLTDLPLRESVIIKNEDSYSLFRMIRRVSLYNAMTKSNGEIVRMKKLGDLEMRLTKELRKQ